MFFVARRRMEQEALLQEGILVTSMMKLTVLFRTVKNRSKMFSFLSPFHGDCKW